MDRLTVSAQVRAPEGMRTVGLGRWVRLDGRAHFFFGERMVADLGSKAERSAGS